MDERENLPAVIAAQAVAVQAEKRGSLVARGMAVLKMDNDARYRQARAVFDRRDSIRNWIQDVAENPALSSAFKIFQRLADENYGKAYYPLSILYASRNDIEDGDSHARHYTQLALDWCLSNRTNDDAELWCDLADMHHSNFFENYGVAQNKEMAEAWYRTAAEQGYARGQWNLGYFLIFDDKYHPGSYWMELAAQQGNVVYQADLAGFYEICSDQYQKAVYWYRMAAEQGDGCGQYCLGKMYEKGLGVDQNDELFVYWIRKAAEQGYGQSQWELGEMFANGRGVAQDYEQAGYWFRKAAEHVGSSYQNKLGMMYMVGRGVPQDDKQAVYWFKKAAAQGDEDGQFNLGFMYNKGRGIEQDDEQAAYWFRKAAEQGVPWAQCRLAIMYKNGVGMERDIHQAEYWYRKAACNTDTTARARLAQKYAKRSLKGIGLDTNKENP